MQKGIKQLEISLHLGIDESTYGKIERGETPLTVDRLLAIASYMKLPLSELIDSAILYSISNGDNSPMSLHHSSLSSNDPKTIDKFLELIDQFRLTIENQNNLLNAISGRLNSK